MDKIPFSSSPSQRFTSTFGEDRIVIEARYNDRSGVWTFDLTRDADQVQLVAGVPLLIGQDMLAPYTLGLGTLQAVDLSSAGLDAGVDDLGSRVVVLWMSAAEFAALGNLVQVPINPLSYPPPVVTSEEDFSWP